MRVHFLALLFAASCSGATMNPASVPKAAPGGASDVDQAAPGTEVTFNAPGKSGNEGAAAEAPGALPAPKSAEGGVSTGRLFYFPYLGEGWTTEQHPDGQGVTLVRGAEMIVIRPCGGLTVGDELCSGVTVACTPAVPVATCEKVRAGAFIE